MKRFQIFTLPSFTNFNHAIPYGCIARDICYIESGDVNWRFDSNYFDSLVVLDVHKTMTKEGNVFVQIFDSQARIPSLQWPMGAFTKLHQTKQVVVERK